jgi:hypothetical protein
LKLLLAARERVKKGDVLNRPEMAKVLEMTDRNLSIIMEKDPDFPIAVRGRQGVAYQLDGRAVIDHMIAGCRALLAERKKRATRLNRLASAGADVAAAEAEDETLSPQDLKITGDAQMTAHKLKLAQGKYLPKDAALAFMLDYHGRFQSETLGLLSRVDPAGQWPAEVRKGVDDGMRTLLVNLQAAMDAFIASHRVQNPA